MKMANGNFGGGTGTEENPYLIEDWADFFAQKSADADGVYYHKMSSDLDGNDLTDGILSKEVDLFHLDGDGHKLKNIKIVDKIVPFIVHGDVKNITFENIQHGGLESQFLVAVDTPPKILNCNFKVSFLNKAYFTNTNFSFQNCSISVEVLTSPGAGFFRSGVFFECGITISFLNSGTMTYNNYTNESRFTRCDIAIKNGVIGRGGTFYMSKVTADMGTDWTSSALTSGRFLLGHYIANSVFILIFGETESTGTYNVEVEGGTSLDATYTGISIIDKSLIPDSVTLKESSYLKGLTTEEMKDVNALKLAGFTNVVEV